MLARLKTFDEIIESLKEIKKHGYHKTIRSGNTGVGATLEHLLQIPENNIAGPNGYQTELKSRRRYSSGMVTLFTKTPAPSKINSALLKHYGYPSKKHPQQKNLHTTAYTHKFNTINNKESFKINLLHDRIEIVHKNPIPSVPVPYWTKASLEKAFLKKYPRWLLFVIADSRGKGENEEFWFNEAYQLYDFSFTNFLKLLENQTIYVDVRIGTYSNGRPHDHGTGFRIQHDKLEQCFSSRTRVL